MTVSAVVETSCDLRVAPLRFDGATAARPQRDAETSIAVGCTPDIAYAVSIDDGQSAAGEQRCMTSGNGGNFLAYEIHRDFARTQRWGTGAGGAASGVVPASGSVSLAAFAGITDREAAAGSYQDTVTITVSF